MPDCGPDLITARLTDRARQVLSGTLSRVRGCCTIFLAVTGLLAGVRLLGNTWVVLVGAWYLSPNRSSWNSNLNCRGFTSVFRPCLMSCRLRDIGEVFDLLLFAICIAPRSIEIGDVVMWVIVFW